MRIRVPTLKPCPDIILRCDSCVTGTAASDCQILPADVDVSQVSSYCLSATENRCQAFEGLGVQGVGGSNPPSPILYYLLYNK